MKKNNFMQGAFIATLGIVITKIIGILYVIPFYQIIGEKGGALYGYAYNIYNIFLNISSAGIPLAISKIISEYNALGLYSDKERAFKIGKRIAIILSIICFIILFFFAPTIAYLIIGDISGGNTIYEITFVIRIISSAILVVPILSVYRGYFQGHKYIEPTSISQVIEQIVRVSFILVGSYLAMKVFNLSLTTTVGIAVFGATIGAFSSYYYIVRKYYYNKSVFTKGSNKKSTIRDEDIFKSIVLYALPLVFIDVFKSIYNSIDMMTVVRYLVNNIGYSVTDAESIMSIISTWGSKLNMIVTSIGVGIVVSLVPNLSENIVVNDKKEINKKINRTFEILLIFVLPMTIGLSLLSKPVWMIFYGFNELAFNTFSFSVFTALFLSMFSMAITIVQIFKDYKFVIISLIVGLLIKLSLNTPLIFLFNNLGLIPHFGNVTATILGYFIPFIMCVIRIKRKYQVSFYDFLVKLPHIIFGTILMIISILLLKTFIPIYSLNRISNIIIVVIYTFVGILAYFIYMWKIGGINEVLGNDLFVRIKKKIKGH